MDDAQAQDRPTAASWSQLAGLIETLAERCVDGAQQVRVGREFEHVREACAAFLLLRGHAAVLTDLVLAGPHTASSGWPIARSMLEVGVRSAWRMLPENRFEAEARWLCFASKRATLYRAQAAWLAEQGLSDAAAQNAAEAVDKFVSDFTGLLTERGVEVPHKEPNLAAVLADLGLADRYHYYRVASERQHGGLVGLEAYSRNLGNERVFGDFSTMPDWLEPLTAALGGVLVLAQVFLSRTDAPPAVFALQQTQSDWAQVLEELANSSG